MVLQKPREWSFKKVGIGKINTCVCVCVCVCVCERVVGVQSSSVLPGCEVWWRRGSR